MRITTILIGIGAVLGATGDLPGQNGPAIAGSSIRAHVRFLASDLLEGRGVGSRGGQLTEEYLAAQLAALGLEGAGDRGSFFQDVAMVGVTTASTSTLRAAGADGRSELFTWQSDWVGNTHLQQPSVEVSAEAVFVGHGIVSPAEKWDDYKGADVRGKIVVLFTNEPQPENPEVFKGKALTYAGRWTYKFEEAARQGAVGCLIIHTTPTAGYGWEVVRNSWGKEDPQMKREPGRHSLSLAGWVSTDGGNKLLALSGHTVDELMKASDSPSFRPVPLKIRLEAKLESSLREVRSRNVLGMLRGSDAGRSSEAVLYSAHWDHLGIGVPVNGDAIYNGAIDNATGCAAVLEIARAYTALQRKPARSVMFAFWTAEESGLRGAEYFAAHPTIALGRIAANLNYDALFPSARTEDIVVSGAERTSLWSTAQNVAKNNQLAISPDPHPEQGSFYRSDHFMLAKRGVPAFKIGLGDRIGGQPAGTAKAVFESYNTQRYHRPGDEYSENWDFASLEHAARFGFLLGLEVANAQALPRWNSGDEFATAER